MHRTKIEALHKEMTEYVGGLEVIAQSFVDGDIGPRAYLAATFGIQEDMDRVRHKLEAIDVVNG